MLSPAGPRVVVAGGGMSGLVAACAALELGASVTLLEKGDALGGSLALSNGFLVGYPDAATLHAAVPGGDPALQSLVAESLPAHAEWLASLGVRLEKLAGRAVGGKLGHRLDPRQAVGALTGRLERGGAEVRAGAALRRLVVRGGALTAVEALDAGRRGVPALLECDAAVVATGGFQGNPELLARLCGLGTLGLYHRSNPWSTGDGLLACLDASAQTSAVLDTFYGHAMAAEPARLGPSSWAAATQYFGCDSVAIDLGGRRFADESAGTGEETLNQALARRPGKLGFYCGDEALLALEAPPGSGTEVADLLRASERLGALVCRSPSLEGLGEQLAAAGCDGRRAVETLRGYKDGIAGGVEVLDGIARRGRRHRLDEPPYWAIKVRASITFTTGGLAVDESMAVLERAGSSSPLAAGSPAPARRRPIPGLYAAGADVGGVSAEGYAGGLASALVTGRIAGRSASSAR